MQNEVQHFSAQVAQVFCWWQDWIFRFTSQELGVESSRLDVEFNQMMAPSAIVSVLPEQQMMLVDSSIDEVGWLISYIKIICFVNFC